MKRDYAEKVNSLLESFYFNIHFVGIEAGSAFALLRHGLSHLYYFALTAGEAEQGTLCELRELVATMSGGSVPPPYDLLSIQR